MGVACIRRMEGTGRKCAKVEKCWINADVGIGQKGDCMDEYDW